MKIICILLIAWTGLAMPLQVRAQRFQYSIQLQEVTFLDGESTPNLFPIKKDDGSGLYVNSGQPHWTQTQSVFAKIPIAYQSGTTPRVTAKFKLECTQPIGNQVKMRGEVRNPNNQEEVITAFEELSINVSSTGNGTYDLLYKRGKGKKPFEKKIRYIRLYSIDWEISFDNGTNWSGVEDNNNSNINELYVTWGHPVAESVGAYEYVHSLFHLSCKVNDNMDITQNLDIFNNIWTKLFAVSNVADNLALVRRDGSQLTYYKSFDALARHSVQLIRQLDGQCFAFASLLSHLCRIQGIDIAQEFSIFAHEEPGQLCSGNMAAGKGFLVAKWNFNQAVCSTDCREYPFVAAYTDPRIGPRVSGITDRYVFTYAEVEDVEGVAGQNNSKPASG